MSAYSWKSGSRYSVDANVVGSICEKLEDEGNLNAKALVDVSRPEEAPTHKLFEWRDDVAAEKYREWQGRSVLNHLEITIPESKEPVKSFISLSEDQNEYHSTTILLKSQDTREAMLRTALMELMAFERKYKCLSELAGLFEASHKVINDHIGD